MIVIASHNRGKIREMKEILQGTDREIVGLYDIGFEDEIVEDGNSLEENAEIKARAVREVHPDGLIVADDTGLFVEALGGAPGIYSARYAGEDCSEQANRDKLLDALKDEENRSCYFETAICYFYPGEEPRFVHGRLDGDIIREERGENGFGYDKIFRPEGEERTLAEMSNREKNEISHRSRALQALKEAIL